MPRARVRSAKYSLALSWMAAAASLSLAASPARAQEGESLDLTELESMSLEELLDTEVTTASKSGEKQSDAPGVISVVTQDELRRFGAVTLKDILNRVPSLISSSTSFADRTTIAARGDQIRVDSGHVLILINGRPTRESLQGGVASEVLEAFPVNIIDRIEVIRGPGSVLYGTNAFSAVINIITERPKAGSKAALKVMGGVPASFGESAKSVTQIGDVGIVLSASHLKLADWDTTYRYSPPDTVRVDEQQISIPDVKQGAYLDLNAGDLRLMSTFNQWDHSYFWRGNVGDNRFRRGFSDLGYRFRLVDSLKWDMELHATYTYAEMRAFSVPGVSRKSHDVIGEWSNFMHLTDNLRLVAGAVYNFIQGEEDYLEDSRRLVVSDGTRESAGFYAQLDYQLIESLKLIGGVQANAIENVDPEVVPRAGIIFNPISQLNFKALYGQAFRAPSLNEINLRHPELWGQTELLPEKVHTIDVGVSYLGDELTAGLNYFNTRQNDIIQIDQTPSTRISAPTYYNNIGEVRLQGLEFEGKYYVIKPVYLTASALYFESKDGEGNEDVTPIPSFGTKAGASYMADGVTASVFHIFQGPLAPVYNARENPDPEAYHLLNGYLSFDLAHAADFRFMDSLSIFLEADNLLDQKVYLPDWGGAIGESIPVNPGRTVFLGISGAGPSGG